MAEIKSVFPNDIYFDKTPEEKAKLRVLAKRLIERMLAHPEVLSLGAKLAPRDKTKEILTSMLTDGSLDHLLVQEFVAEVEPYFELKDELASKGIEIFNADIEHACSSEAVQQERSQKMVNYLFEHQCLLSADTINTNDLVNPNLIKKGYYFLAMAWCFVWQNKLAGIELYALDEESEPRKQLSAILEHLVRAKNRGSFLQA